jgi:hypothetical protein
MHRLSLAVSQRTWNHELGSSPRCFIEHPRCRSLEPRWRSARDRGMIQRVAEPKKNKLNDDERMEYQEIGEFARHDDTVNLTVSTVLLPVLVAALGWAWQHHDLEGPLALGSLVLWAYWIVVNRRRNHFLGLRLSRARALEEEAELHHHRDIHEADQSQDWLLSLVRIKEVERLASVGLFWAWIWLILTPSFSLAVLGLMTIVAVFAFAPELNRTSTR